MKKFILMMIISFVSISTYSNSNYQKDKDLVKIKLQKIEVFYFHYTRRCTTCKAVETETLNSLVSLYPAHLKSGKLVFRSINLDEKSNRNLINKYKAEGQSLVVFNNKNRFDLTDKGFLYASNQPEKLKTELKKIIDPLLE